MSTQLCATLQMMTPWWLHNPPHGWIMLFLSARNLLLLIFLVEMVGHCNNIIYINLYLVLVLQAKLYKYVRKWMLGVCASNDLWKQQKPFMA